ncbi:MAG: CDP-alcohol phosphatidyltransferase family protein [Clostridia bacterium]|nr:CDP-alcohol phosphatidyltransferase family protein [Clostridia bacterium]
MKEKKQAFIGYYHYGVVLTYLSVCAAIVGICFSVGGNKDNMPWVGVICLIISGICDAFDGLVASTRKNRTREDKMFGGRIDSLSDLLAFGVAPAMIGFGMNINRWYFIPAYAFFVLCALIRLAYFDVTEIIRAEDPNCGKRDHYIGMPVTSVAFGLPVFYLVATIFDPSSIACNTIMTVGYLLMGICMITRFKTKKFSPKGICIAFGILAVILTALIFVHIKVFDMEQLRLWKAV